GSGVTASSASGLFLGTAGPVTTITNPDYAVQGQFPGVMIDLTAGHVTGPPPTGAWTRMIAFRAPTLPGTSPSGQAANLWWTQNVTDPVDNGSAIFAALVNPGNIQIGIAAPGWDYTVLDTVGNVCDGNWHLLMFGLAADGLSIFAWLDGVAYSTPTIGPDLHPTQIGWDMLGSAFISWKQGASGSFSGDLAHAAEFPFLLSAAQVATLYASWRSASSGESSGARVKRMLGWIGWTGPTSIDTGSTTSMGPATDLTGGSALDALNTICETEGGLAYASTAGQIVFRARSALYNSVPQFVFGENRALGEWPYQDVNLPTDPMLTYNIVPVAQSSTGQVATTQDTASQQDYFQRTMPQRSVNAASFAEVQAASAYLLGRHANPAMRCEGLVLHTCAVPGLARVAAQLEIGTRIRVFKRPPWRMPGAYIQFDGFIQRIERSVDPTSGEAFTTVTAFPADQQEYWVLAALHTTLNAQAASGQNKATIKALPDAAVNALSQSLPRGYQLTFEPGSARQETMTLAATGIPATSPGYTTATLTFTANLAFTHPADSVVCEPLPQGYTDPTTWDASSVLGASSTTVLSGGASGTNTVTVGPLQDAAVNPLGSVWNAGDTIQLSPGTADDETATIKSVAATLPGYTSCVITLAANLAHSHAADDTVCDPLPAGVTSPSQLAPTARLAY
ncbi:MAG TPA: hypothetical protein VN088_15720, partial [Nocardioides sp.]|nr:hypothetical protein [Nocardioides sp.]